MRFAKGHGTGNDFVIVPDPEGALDLTADLVAALCDRHFGLGADGVLRVVRTGAAGPDAAGQDAPWFMDYRNADGSIAEMCGNGVRVFARYLLATGLATGCRLAVGTRAGVRQVAAEPDGQFTVDMGAAEVLGTGTAVLVDGALGTGGRRLSGLAISVGNPHLACLVDEPVIGIDLADPQVAGPAELAGGANVEVVRILADHEVEMRVHERGSGLTLSCGTGAVAAAVAAAVAVAEWPAPAEARSAAASLAGASPVAWTVHVPGGTLTVVPSATASLLTGPAEIVATGELAAGWLAARSLARGLAAVPAGLPAT